MSEIKPGSIYRETADKMAADFVKSFARGGRRMEALQAELSGAIETQMRIVAADVADQVLEANKPLLDACRSVNTQLNVWWHVLDSGKKLGDISVEIAELGEQVSGAIAQATGNKL